MPEIIIDLTTSELRIKKKSRFLNLVGFIFTALPIIFFVAFMAFYPERMGKTISVRIFSIIVISFLLFYLSRVLFLLIVDKDLTILKIGEGKFKIREKEYLHANIVSLLIVEYFGFRTMPNKFHIFLKMSNKFKIALVVRIDKEDMENAVSILKEFLKVEKVEKKFWWVN